MIRRRWLYIDFSLTLKCILMLLFSTNELLNMLQLDVDSSKLQKVTQLQRMLIHFCIRFMYFQSLVLFFFSSCLRTYFERDIWFYVDISADLSNYCMCTMNTTNVSLCWMLLTLTFCQHSTWNAHSSFVALNTFPANSNQFNLNETIYFNSPTFIFFLLKISFQQFENIEYFV